MLCMHMLLQTSGSTVHCGTAAVADGSVPTAVTASSLFCLQRQL